MVRADGVFDKTLNMGAITDEGRLASVKDNTDCICFEFDCLFYI